MAETLFIRLGSKATDVIYWLIQDAEQQIIASGELANADCLIELTTKAANRDVVALAPACDFVMRQLQVPGKSQRAIKAATPYVLEDDLAQEVEALFFAYGQIDKSQPGNCFTLAVNRQVLQTWLAWLTAANLKCSKLLPDALLLPHKKDHIAMVQLGEQWLIRQSSRQAVVIEQTLLPAYLSLMGSESLQLAHYSPLPQNLALPDNVQLMPQEEELPLALLANGVKYCPINILQGEFQVKNERSAAFPYWLAAATFAGLCLTMVLVNKISYLQQLTAQQQQIEQHIIGSYKKAFPNVKRVRVSTVKSQLKRKLKSVSAGNSQSDFLTILAKLQPAFSTVSALKPASLKFDGNRQELRIQAVANNYQAFEQFKAKLQQADFIVNQGALNNQGNQVSGSFSIKGKS